MITIRLQDLCQAIQIDPSESWISTFHSLLIERGRKKWRRELNIEIQLGLINLDHAIKILQSDWLHPRRAPITTHYVPCFLSLPTHFWRNGKRHHRHGEISSDNPCRPNSSLKGLGTNRKTVKSFNLLKCQKSQTEDVLCKAVYIELFPEWLSYKSVKIHNNALRGSGGSTLFDVHQW